VTDIDRISLLIHVSDQFTDGKLQVSRSGTPIVGSPIAIPLTSRNRRNITQRRCSYPSAESNMFCTLTDVPM